MKHQLARRLTPWLVSLTLFCSAALIFYLHPLSTRLKNADFPAGTIGGATAHPCTD